MIMYGLLERERLIAVIKMRVTLDLPFYLSS
jgi:hypothetical protein